MSPLVHEPDPLMAPVTRARILLIESDSALRGYLAEHLEHSGYVVVDQTPADLTVLGFDHWGPAARNALGEVRRRQTEPVLVMAPQSTAASRRAIIDAGAGDYAPKPVSVTELLARIQALLYRRSVQGDGAVVIQGNLLIDTGRRMVSIAGRDVDLTAAEYGLLKVLVANVGRTMGP
ncbi:MAG: response regulator transcription factor, partial [Mycobacterium leprae]